MTTTTTTPSGHDPFRNLARWATEREAELVAEQAARETHPSALGRPHYVQPRHEAADLLPLHAYGSRVA